MNTFENLALWYLRLNGYLTMANFIAHGDSANTNTRTEADIVGVRFPFSEEFDPDDDDRRLVIGGKIDVVLVDAKQGRCALNSAWTEPSVREPLEYILKRVGFLRSEEMKRVAGHLYEARRWEDAGHRVRLVCFGCSKSEYARDATQILWEDVVCFIAKRFAKYHDPKRDHSQWDPFGRYLWDKLNRETISYPENIPTAESLIAEWDEKSRECSRQSRN